MINWDDYRVFLGVARAGSLTAAAPKLQLDPATVSRRIARLEQTMGAQLFKKLQNGYALTASGTEFLNHITAMEATEKLAQGNIRKAGTGMSGTVRIGAPDGLANFVLPQVCTAINKTNPELDIQILSLPRIFNLSQRQIDIAVMVTPPKTGQLLIQRITDYTLHLAAHRDYLASHAPISSKADLKKHQIVGYIRDLIFDESLEYSTDLARSKPPELSSNSVGVQMQLLQAGGGLGVVHDFALPRYPEIQRILTDQFSLTRSFYAVRQKEDTALNHLDEFTARLVNDIRTEVQRLQTL